jgi:hypothetical protein
LAQREDMRAEAIPSFVVIVGRGIVVKDSARTLCTARLVHEMAGFVVGTPKAPHAAEIAVLLPELRIDVTGGIERGDELIAMTL